MYDVDLSVRSPIEVLIRTVVNVSISENNNFHIPVTCNISLKSLNGRVRLFFSNSKECWSSLLGTPVIKLNIDPVIGSEN